MGATDQAVVVGITHYPGLENLKGSENDAKDFAGWLEDHTGGAVPEDNIQLILSSQYQPPAATAIEANPTAEAVTRAFRRLAEAGRAAGDGLVGRRLYIFMAGHGFAPDLASAALLMADAAKGSMGMHIPGRAYADFFLKAGYFKEVVLFMDCCRDNYPLVPLQQVPFDDTTGSSLTYFYGFATSFARRAREEEDADGRSGGIFTRRILQGLRGSAVEAQTSIITGDSLADFVYNAPLSDDPTRSRQDPKFEYERNPQIVFVENMRGPLFAVRVALSAANAAKPVELRDGTLQVLPPTSVVSGAVEWRGLAPGLYEVVLAGESAAPLSLLGTGGTIDVSL